MKLIHPDVRCYECDDTGSVLVEVNPDVGSIFESCEVCGQRRYDQKVAILADAKVNYTLHASVMEDGAKAATVSYGPAYLGTIRQQGSSWVGHVPFAGEWNVARAGDRTAFGSHDEAAVAVVSTAATYGRIG